MAHARPARPLWEFSGTDSLPAGRGATLLPMDRRPGRSHHHTRYECEPFQC